MVTTRNNPLYVEAFNFPTWRRQEYATALKQFKTLMLVLRSGDSTIPTLLLGPSVCSPSFLQMLPNLEALRLNFRGQFGNHTELENTRKALSAAPLRILELGKFSDKQNVLTNFVGQFRSTLEELVLFKVSSSNLTHRSLPDILLSSPPYNCVLKALSS
jgi:hypothetical protein